MPTVKMDFSEDVFSALRRSPEEFAREMRLAAAIYWYARGEVSQEKAAQIAGMDRFPGRFGAPPSGRVHG